MMFRSGLENACCHFSAPTVCVQTHAVACTYSSILCAFWKAPWGFYVILLQTMKVMFCDAGLCDTIPKPSVFQQRCSS